MLSTHMTNVGKPSCFSSRNSHRMEEKWSYFAKRCIKASRNLTSSLIKKDEEIYFNCLWGSLRTKGLLFSLRHAFFLSIFIPDSPVCSFCTNPKPPIALLWFRDTIPHNFQSVHAMIKVCPSAYSSYNKLGIVYTNKKSCS